jgi:hypothetical protein
MPSSILVRPCGNSLSCVGRFASAFGCEKSEKNVGNCPCGFGHFEGIGY